MKVMKSEEVLTEQTLNNEVDQAKLDQLQEKFDVLQSTINNKQYNLLLDDELTSVLMNEVFPKFQWKGYESYAVSETYTQLEKARTGNGIDSKFSAEIIEATFHFLKNFIGTGFEIAIPFKKICDQFALPVQEINQDRQNLKDVSLEIIATEKGIRVEDLVEALNASNQQG
jgi:hypothetical protein